MQGLRWDGAAVRKVSLFFYFFFFFFFLCVCVWGPFLTTGHTKERHKQNGKEHNYAHASKRTHTHTKNAKKQTKIV